ncbi:hypothetical protein JCM6882_003271 [Rhodosporidiobolus microsporus]
MPSTTFSDDHTFVGSSANGTSSLDFSTKPIDKGKRVDGSPPPRSKASFLDNAPSLAALGTTRTPFFQTIDETTGGLVDAVKRLDEELSAAGRYHLISHKSAWRFMGRTTQPGCAGLYTNGAQPRLILEPGRYPVAGNQAAIVADPSTSVFLVKNGGFCALSLNGHYRVLGVVDMVNLKMKIVDNSGSVEKRTLGHYQEISAFEDLAVIDRQFKGETARTLDSLTVRALAAQVEAANIDRENSNKGKAQEGTLQVATVAAKQRKTEADAAAYTTIAAAKASAEAVEIAARARANAVALEAEADANVRDDQARRMQMARIEVNRVAAYGNRTVFVFDSGLGGTVMAGHAFAVGAAQAGGKA